MIRDVVLGKIRFKYPITIRDEEHFLTASQRKQRRRELTGQVTIRNLNETKGNFLTKKEVLNLPIPEAKSYMERILYVNKSKDIEDEWQTSTSYIANVLRKKLGFRKTNEIKATGPINYLDSTVSSMVTIKVTGKNKKADDKADENLQLETKKEFIIPKGFYLRQEIEMAGDKIEDALEVVGMMLDPNKNYSVDVSITCIKIGSKISMYNNVLVGSDVIEFFQEVSTNKEKTYMLKIEIGEN